MASKDTSVYSRPGSPKWYVSYWCAKRMKRVHEATPWRVEDAAGKKHALRFADAKSQEASAFRGVRQLEVWSAWVEKYLSDKFRQQQRTLTRYLNAWDQLRVFLDTSRLPVPAAVTYLHCIGYLEWRLTMTERNCGRPVTRNTAIFELKVFGGIMGEAVRRNFTTVNPCVKMGLRRDPAKEKAEMSDVEITRIRDELAKRERGLMLPDRWMSITFEVAIHQGCRLTETQLPMTSVDLRANTIKFSGKGRNGMAKVFTTALHPGLRPLMAQLSEAKAVVTCTHPKMASVKWHLFLKEIKLGHLCFHCTRVTVITRLARAGVPIQQAMRFVGHSSEQVHAIYQKLKADDLSACTTALASLSALPS